MKVPGQVLQALGCSEGDLKPTRMGFELAGKSYIFKEGGAMANHKAEFVSTPMIVVTVLHWLKTWPYSSR